MPTWKEQRFTAPGTWTWPGVANVEVILVGGGGGGYATPTPRLAGGGGGGYRREYWPVSGPVPITVGSGGATSSNPSVPGTNGGTSFFGSAGPGPVPAIPPTTVAVGGGGGGGCEAPTTTTGNPAPPIGGGGGGSSNTVSGGFGGLYGHRGNYGFGGGAGGGGVVIAANRFAAGQGVAGMGGGGSALPTTPTFDGGSYRIPFGPGLYDKPAVLGGGGAANNAGAPGIVIVRWFE